MKIIFFTWNEITAPDLYDSLLEKGLEVCKCEYELKSYIEDASFVIKFEELIKNENPDGIITFNFLPIISKIALRNKLPYISWIYDSPCLTMYSEMIFNPYNYMFHFDSSEVNRIRGLGVKNIWYMPLGVNTVRIDKILNRELSDRLKCDVSFMGNLYNDEYDYIGNMKGLPDRYRGYLNAVIDASTQICGTELMEELLKDEVMKNISPHFSFSKEKEFFIEDKTMLMEIIKKRVSMKDRIAIVRELSKVNGFKLFTNSDCSEIDGVEGSGIINYYSEMPLLFKHSKVNLNITLRNIKAGIPLRAMDICGAGGFLLSNPTEDLLNTFSDDEVAIFFDKSDCVEKVKYYMIHEDERIEMAKKANAKVRENYNYCILLDKIFDIVFKG